MATDNKQNDQKEARKNPGVSNYVIIPVALAATLCGWITSPYGEALIKEVEAHWLHVVYLVYPAFTVLGGGSMLQRSTRAGKAALGALATFGIVFGFLALTK
ncbi:hypothetical protein Megvenef_01193 [Candidatus Megaera venefica]|uniref:Uncharacterized protein n=1 Tax=Candidatus Megaera venefica TaxID=2055910 RepID=A0ABU5NDI4_9RICK|nr:hypothetical protein [Candidatus Megaera venefica]MEA0971220.1 hypothetical protein [Candidatus Megaera venefica]